MIRILQDKLKNISTANKLRFLFIIIAGGIIAVGIFSYLALYSLKYDFDTLFKNRTVSSIKLQELKDVFAINIMDTMLDVDKKAIDVNKSKQIVELARELVGKEWSEYKNEIKNRGEYGLLLPYLKTLSHEYFNESRYKEPLAKEEDYLLGVENGIYRINFLCDKIFELLDYGRNGEASMLITDELYPAVNAVNIRLAELIHLQMESAIYEKEITDNIYKITGIVILCFVLFVLLASILLSRMMLSNISNTNKNLAKIVAKKTKELSELNKSLEERVAKEVAENRRKDKIMYHQARLAAMGEMIANIAHQWRQPLNSLSAIIQSFETKNMVGKLTDEFISKQVEEGVRIAAKMSDTIDDFRNFFKPNRAGGSFDICEAVQKSISLFQSINKELSIELISECSGKIIVNGYENEFLQAAMNMLANSKDAFMDKEITNKQINIKVRVKKDFVSVYFIDNAGGIEPGVMENIFDPYFTTKHKSSGTGIGLYMTKQIIESHMSGSVIVRNIRTRLGDGAMFIFRVPLAKNA